MNVKSVGEGFQDRRLTGNASEAQRAIWQRWLVPAAGKIGGFAGVFLFPILLGWHGLLAAESAAAAVSILGLIDTVATLPESKGRSLEELEAA